MVSRRCAGFFAAVDDVFEAPSCGAQHDAGTLSVDAEWKAASFISD